MLPAGPRGATADNDDKVVLQEKFQGRVGGPRQVISINMLRQEGVRKEPSKRGKRNRTSDKTAGHLIHDECRSRLRYQRQS